MFSLESKYIDEFEMAHYGKQVVSVSRFAKLSK